AFGITSSNPAGAISRAISATSADGGTRTILGALALMRLPPWLCLPNARALRKGDSHVAELQDRLAPHRTTMARAACVCGRELHGSYCSREERCPHVDPHQPRQRHAPSHRRAGELRRLRGTEVLQALHRGAARRAALVAAAQVPRRERQAAAV